MTPDYEALGFWLDVAQWVGLGIASLLAIAASRRRTVDDHEKRLVLIEAQMEHLPQDSEIKELTASIAALQGDVKAISADLKGVSTISKMMQRQINTMDEWLRRSASEGR